jgi:hypothetical protein
MVNSALFHQTDANSHTTKSLTTIHALTESERVVRLKKGHRTQRPLLLSLLAILESPVRFLLPTDVAPELAQKQLALMQLTNKDRTLSSQSK